MPAARRYLPGTMVLETSWDTRGGWIIVRDVLLIGPWHHEHDRSHTHRRAPTDYDADHVLLRTVRCVNGEVQLSLDCEPVFDYGRVRGRWEYAGDGLPRGRRAAAGVGRRAAADVGPQPRHRGPARDRAAPDEGGRAACSARCPGASTPRRATYDEAYERLVWTAHHWQHWLDRGEFPDHPWRSDLQRSALTLKGLTYAPTGAIVAAATTSLPETPGGERNWDYRYTWIRDSTFALWGLYTLGFDWEANDFFYFVADVAEAVEGRLQIMYGIDGRAELPEETLDHLSGYENARPVRIGNGAHDQDQHDVWGAVLDSVYLHTKSRDHLPERVWPILVKQVEAALANWREPDRGIWEVRGEPQALHLVEADVLGGARPRRAPGRAARGLGPRDAAGAPRPTRSTPTSASTRVDERGVFTQHYDTDGARRLGAADAARALPARRRPAHPRDRARDRRRADRGRARRCATASRRPTTGCSGEEGTFTICSFWLVSALCEIGEVERARGAVRAAARHTRARSGCTPRRSTPRTGRHLGNFPQAFTHLALINAVMHVIRAEQQQERVFGPEAADGQRRTFTP